jgi:hypothetical protein
MISRCGACLFASVACIVVLCCGKTNAMNFRIEWNPDEKINVIIGEGQIEDGDAGRLERLFRRPTETVTAT